MAQVIKLKHSLVTAQPVALAQAEPAYSEQSNIFYIGTADGQVVPIGGKAFVDKLGTVETGATGDQTGAEMASLIAALANSNLLTDGELAKLTSLESSHFKGEFPTLVQLQSTFPTATAGDYASVDLGVDSDVVRYVWDTTDNKWVEQLGVSTTETAASVLAKLLENPNVHVLTDAEAAKLTVAPDWADSAATGEAVRAVLESVGLFGISATDKTQLARVYGMETGATADQTGAEIVTLASAEADTNFLTDAQVDHLVNIEANATADQTGAEMRTLLAGEADTNIFNNDAKNKVDTLGPLAHSNIVDGGSF